MKRKFFTSALLTAALCATLCAPVTAEGLAGLTQRPARLTSIDSRQLDGLLIGKTKEEIRALLGKPSTDFGEYWYYWPTRLQVYDAEEGAYSRGSLMIRFDISYYGAAIGYEVQ
ncbi:hypothetical protein [Methylobacterium soli]|uniref:Outer membrane protein assembly factor BamE n=1 Tax=Methylobacterium soli TaxID=553447 RepID=A0A6L3SX79_9HYPH|nr:hypothetical protein [Methylobacterium soli]KAB1078391.1 hypothetical protein F6X53_15005 [Methylobacterium soli]GJE45808.1 hypothetical protein AEGHOMDF_5008 [Methylobacterium soli]